MYESEHCKSLTAILGVPIHFVLIHQENLIVLKQQITQQELRTRLAQSAGVSEESVSKILSELVAIATSEARQNGGFLLPGIGMINNVERFQRTGVHPETGQKIMLGRTTKLHFGFASRFKKAVAES